MTEDEIELKIKDIQNYDPEKFQREFEFKLDLLSNKTKVKITPKQNTTKGEIK